MAEPSTAGRIRELVTPEGVDLRLRLGEGGERAAAFLLDGVIMIGALIALTLVVFVIVVGAGARGAFAEAAAVIWLLGFFLLRNAYFIFFELRPGAATPGKRILGLRVVSRNGGRLTADAVFARNFVRELEVYLPLTFIITQREAVDAILSILGMIWCGIFVFFPLFNKDRLRVGDLIAGTWVVKAPKHKLQLDLSESGAQRLHAFAFTSKQLDAYGVHELHVLEEVLRRNDKRTLRAVADRIRAKINWQAPSHENDLEFLTAYYAGLRGRLEQQLLFGRRRKDKYDVETGSGGRV